MRNSRRLRAVLGRRTRAGHPSPRRGAIEASRSLARARGVSRPARRSSPASLRWLPSVSRLAPRAAPSLRRSVPRRCSAHPATRRAGCSPAGCGGATCQSACGCRGTRSRGEPGRRGALSTHGTSARPRTRQRAAPPAPTPTSPATPPTDRRQTGVPVLAPRRWTRRTPAHRVSCSPAGSRRSPRRSSRASARPASDPTRAHPEALLCRFRPCG